jgi:hypothetical protein
MRRNAQGRIVSSLKTLAQFSEILRNAPSGILTGWIGDGDLDHGCDQKSLDLCHCYRQFRTLALTEWLQQGTGKGIGSVIKLCSLTKASLGQLDEANSAISLTRPHHNQALFLKRAQQATDVGRIERQPTSQFPNARPLFSDLPQEPCFAKRMVSAQEVIGEDTNALCHGPIETSNLFNQWHLHETLQTCSISIFSFSDYSQRICSDARDL